MESLSRMTEEINTKKILDALENIFARLKHNSISTKIIADAINSSKAQELSVKLEAEARKISEKMRIISEAKVKIRELGDESTRDGAVQFLEALKMKEFAEECKAVQLENAKNNLRLKKELHEALGGEDIPDQELPQQEARRIVEEIEDNVPNFNQEVVQHIQTEDGRREFMEFLDNNNLREEVERNPQTLQNPRLQAEFAFQNDSLRHRLEDRYGRERLERHKQHLRRLEELQRAAQQG